MHKRRLRHLPPMPLLHHRQPPPHSATTDSTLRQHHNRHPPPPVGRDSVQARLSVLNFRFVVNIVDHTSNVSLLLWDREVVQLTGKKVTDVNGSTIEIKKKKKENVIEEDDDDLISNSQEIALGD
ncbi:uncharacterized protein LOC121763969 isoform X2 [Salvia splendens]|uniref:uncharacterized protein LOC121763969 isoform X2 n=1 Tax=Salvia splendens TaxID=180675 RepID=UPI001C25F205|nr:uncharacterized protein LOC121763969 isoform X2 [Salvia splendens]